MSILLSILPSTGFICVAEALDKGFKHHWCDDAAMAERVALRIDKAGKTVFVAQASFTTATTRKAVNSAFLKNFFLDIDCGAGKPYPTQKDGLSALLKFCKTTTLPAPTVVNSGNGLYAHWVLASDLEAGAWVNTAKLFQKLIKEVEPGLDGDGICADRARVLRLVGSHNKKDPKNPKEVKILHRGELIGHDVFAGAVKEALRAAGVALPSPKIPSIVTNAVFTAGLEESRPSYAKEIASKCGQIAALKASKGDVSEPLWYSAIGVLRFTVESPAVIHEWSQGHTDYSIDKTDAKIHQHEKSGVGPTTCAKFNIDNPSVCSGCRFSQKIVSPISLGYEAPKALDAPKGSEYPPPPSGFILSKSGVYYDDGDTPICLYPYPLYVASVNQDHFGESFTIKHQLPHDGWKEFSLPSKHTVDHKTLFSALIDDHVQILGKDNKSLFAVYIEASMANIRKAGKLAKLYGQMGWVQEDDAMAFIQGPSVYRKGVDAQKVGYSATAPEFVKSLVPQGDTSTWVENTKILNREGLEGLAFEFLCAAFAAPLVKFTGYEGAMLSVVGGSGVGKTLTASWGISAWGDAKRLTLYQKDTENAFVGRLGVYNTLPVYMDEISNISSEAMSDLAYKVTQGRDKIRLTQKAVERKGVNSWNTLAIASSNHSLVDKLSSLKGDAGAEINRIFEYEVSEGFTTEESRKIFNAFTSDFGGVGERYAQYLVDRQEDHKAGIEKVKELISRRVGDRPEERYWIMVAAVAVYGGLIAKKVGVSHIAVERLIPWIEDVVKGMRGCKDANSFDAVSFLGSLLDRYSNGVLMVRRYDPKSKIGSDPARIPTGRLVARIEEDVEMLWVSLALIKSELAKIHVSPRKMAADLKGKGLIEAAATMSLGRGTDFSSVQQSCWKLDLSNPVLGHCTVALVKDLREMNKKENVNV